MHLLSLLHRWIGAIMGVVLGLLGLTGAVLVWRDALTFVPHAGDAVARDPVQLARVAALWSAGPVPIERLTFASGTLGVHQAAFADGSGAYIAQSGEVVARWSSLWQRPELWLFDLHRHLLSGDVGETAAGIAGLIGIGFVVTGVILWWRTRRRFRLRLWPAKMTPGAIVHQHRDLGVVTTPLLVVSLLTGVMLALPGVSAWLLSPLGREQKPVEPSVPVDHVLAAHPDFRPVFAAVRARFPGAEPRRLQWPKKPGAPLTLRLRQSFEWNGNGRSFLYFDPATMAVIGASDAATVNPATTARGMVYPLHAGEVGGLAWKLAMTASGLALALLGSLAVYGFWRTRMLARRARRRRTLV
jgi:uncharacterized iron-regulated membrane protein